MNSHERFAIEEPRSNVERRSLMFILLATSILVGVAGGVECNSDRCGDYEVYSIVASVISVVGIGAALFFFWNQKGEYERIFAGWFALFWVVNVIVLTFVSDTSFSFTSSGYFAVLSTAFFAAAYLNQVIPSENGDRLLSVCFGSGWCVF